MNPAPTCGKRHGQTVVLLRVQGQSTGTEGLGSRHSPEDRGSAGAREARSGTGGMSVNSSPRKQNGPDGARTPAGPCVEPHPPSNVRSNNMKGTNPERPVPMRRARRLSRKALSRPDACAPLKNGCIS